jgi:hypothetical protein
MANTQETEAGGLGFQDQPVQHSGASLETKKAVKENDIPGFLFCITVFLCAFPPLPSPLNRMSLAQSCLSKIFYLPASAS